MAFGYPLHMVFLWEYHRLLKGESPLPYAAMFGYQRVYGWIMLDIIEDIMCILTHAMCIHTIQSSYTGGLMGYR